MTQNTRLVPTAARRPWKAQSFEKEGGVFSDIKVLDLTRLVAGNMATLQLADFGAEVIKVEPYESGDPLRTWTTAGIDSFWKVYGRNKKSLALDFHHPAATALLRKLCLNADVLIEGFKPGTMEAMNLDPNYLQREAPHLIILRISGFGQTGPNSARPGFGTIVESLSGFAARNGTAEGPPTLPPIALADMVTGLYGFGAVATALFERSRSGLGQVIDLSLLDATVSILGPDALDYAITGTSKPRVGNRSMMSAPRNVYYSRDDVPFSLSAPTQRMAARLFEVMARSDLMDDPRFCTNEARVRNAIALDQDIQNWMRTKDADALNALFLTNGITAAPVNDIEAITGDQHFVERETYVTVPDADIGQAPMHRTPPRFSRTPARIARPAPLLGADSADILERAGLNRTEIAEARENGVVHCPSEPKT